MTKKKAANAAMAITGAVGLLVVLFVWAPLWLSLGVLFYSLLVMGSAGFLT